MNKKYNHLVFLFTVYALLILSCQSKQTELMPDINVNKLESQLNQKRLEKTKVVLNIKYDRTNNDPDPDFSTQSLSDEVNKINLSIRYTGSYSPPGESDKLHLNKESTSFKIGDGFIMDFDVPSNSTLHKGKIEIYDTDSKLVYSEGDHPLTRVDGRTRYITATMSTKNKVLIELIDRADTQFTGAISPEITVVNSSTSGSVGISNIKSNEDPTLKLSKPYANLDETITLTASNVTPNAEIWFYLNNPHVEFANSARRVKANSQGVAKRDFFLSSETIPDWYKHYVGFYDASIYDTAANKSIKKPFMIVEGSGDYEKMLPEGTSFSEFYTHGLFPSWGQRFHIGIDLGAPEGTPVLAVEQGIVEDVIKSDKDPNFNSLGYMVIIKRNISTAKGLKKAYDLYLHLQEPPMVSIGDSVHTQQQIAKLGQTGAANGIPHVHFETRFFKERFSSRYKNIYPPEHLHPCLAGGEEREYFETNYAHIVSVNVPACADFD